MESAHIYTCRCELIFILYATGIPEPSDEECREGSHSLLIKLGTMDKNRIEAFMLNNRHFFAIEDIPLIQVRMESADDSKWQYLSYIKLKDPQVALMLSIFGGPIGFDRFYIGDYLLGILKTITCGGLLIWAIIDLFLIRNSAQKYNKSIVMDILR